MIYPVVTLTDQDIELARRIATERFRRRMAEYADKAFNPDQDLKRALNQDINSLAGEFANCRYLGLAPDLTQGVNPEYDFMAIRQSMRILYPLSSC